MMDQLRVRVYNVRFGDAILVTIPDKGADGEIFRRNILFDVGNSLTKEGGCDAVFQPVIENILEELGGRPLDLYIMTHEHMDHIQGLPYAECYLYTSSDTDLKDKLKTQYAWLTASAENDYYKNHPDAEKAKLAFVNDYNNIASFIRTSDYLKSVDKNYQPILETILNINNPRSSKENVEYLQNLAQNTFYVHSETKLDGKHPFQEAQFEIWAPEEDTSIYYGRYRLPSLGLTWSEENMGAPALIDYYPPSGVDANVFYDLIDIRRQFVECLLSIDKAENNTSVVCCIEWRGWRLLFTGDAEVKSWKIMRDRERLKEVDFLKVSHHGSHNGTPDEDILDVILKKRDVKGKQRRAVVSTWHNTYSGVPDEDTLKRLYDPKISGLQTRCDSLIRVDESLGDELYVDLFFPGEAG